MSRASPLLGALRRLFLISSPPLLFRLQHYKLHSTHGTHRYWARPNHPKTFNEHIIARKLDQSYRRLSAFVDKAQVKGFVASRVSRRHLIPTYGVYQSLSAVRDAELAMPCVVKPTHMSGEVLFAFGEDELNTPGAARTINRWLRTNHYFMTGEPQYRDIPPRIIVEPFIGREGQAPRDFKFFCWNGEPRLLQVDSDRFNDHRRDFFDMDLHRVPIRLRYRNSESPPTLPTRLDMMVDICRKLSSDFSFVRVDLYETPETVYFGELTFHPESGNGPFGDYASDRRLGEFFAAQ
jgi:hypothetical protein